MEKDIDFSNCSMYWREYKICLTKIKRRSDAMDCERLHRKFVYCESVRKVAEASAVEP